MSAPSACLIEDLPGFSPRMRAPSRKTCSSVNVLVFLFACTLLPVSEACLPSWFRHERSEPEPLKGNEIEGSDLFEPNIDGIGVQSVQSNNFENTNKIEDYEDLDSLYGTAKPLVVDEKLEIAKKLYFEQECHGWCFRGGTCHVDVDDITYEYVGKRCTCPHEYWGARCDFNYVKRLYSPVMGRGVQVERSAVPALAIVFIIIVITIGIAVYTYRKLTGRVFDGYKSGASSMVLSQQLHLRRRSMVYGIAGIDCTPGSTSSRTPFSPAPRRNGRLAVEFSPNSLPLSSIGLSLPSTQLMSNSHTNQITTTTVNETEVVSLESSRDSDNSADLQRPQPHTPRRQAAVRADRLGRRRSDDSLRDPTEL